MNIALNWTDFSNIVDTKSLAVQYKDTGEEYEICASDGAVTYTCVIIQDASTKVIAGMDTATEEANETDFETNYKPTANTRVSSVLTLDENITAIETGTHERFVYFAQSFRDGVSQNMNVDGSSTPVNYDIDSGDMGSIVGYLESINFLIYDPGVMGNGKFGAVDSLSNGLSINFYLNSTNYEFLNLRNNRDILGKVNDDLYVPGSASGFFDSEDWLKGTVNFGKPIKVDFSAGDYLRVIVRDDLSGISQLRMSGKIYRILS